MTARHRALLLGGILVIAAALVWLFGPLPRYDFRIEAEPGDPASFVVRVTASNARARLWLYTRKDAQTTGTSYLKVYANGVFDTPLFGTYERLNNELLFRPAVPPLPGSWIAATFAEGSQTKAEFEMPGEKAAQQAARVLAIRPSMDALPENLIKFYIEFSRPMTQGDFFQHVVLLNETTSKPVPGAFREVELWSPDGRRFTLWLHPGRQKTGVNLNEDEGPVLREGGKYTLRVLDTLTDFTGARLQTPATKTFTVAPHDGTVPEMRRWQVKPPAKGSLEALSVVFDEPMDWAMLETALWVTNDTGAHVAGMASRSSEREWRFVPAIPWAAGSYQLHASADLEDLAGNSLARPFESALNETSRASPPVPATELSFSVK